MAAAIQIKDINMKEKLTPEVNLKKLNWHRVIIDRRPNGNCKVMNDSLTGPDHQW